MRTLRPLLLVLCLVACLPRAGWTQSPNGDVFDAGSPYAGLSPLDGRPEMFPASGNPPQCIPPVKTWKLVGRKSSDCYYFDPDPINGYITSKNNVGKLQKFYVRCGSNPFDRTTVICQNPGDDRPGAPPTTGPPVGSGVSATGHDGEVFSGGASGDAESSDGGPSAGGGTTGNGGGAGPHGGARIPGPAGGRGYTPGADPCRPFGAGGYDYCANPRGTRLPPGCSCDGPPATPRLKGGVSVTRPGETSKSKPGRPNVDGLRYTAGFINGVGNCLQSFVNLIAGAGWLARGALKAQIVPTTILTDGDFANAAVLLGLQPGESITLRQIAAEAGAPKISFTSGVDPYVAATSAGQRVCAFVAAPAFGKILHGPKTPPKSMPGGSQPSPPPAALPPDPSTPGTLPRTPGTLPDRTPGTLPHHAGEAPGPSVSLGGSSPSQPIPGPTLVGAVSKTASARGLTGTWVKTPGGSLQLGTFLGRGTFGGVFQLVKNPSKVIKIPTNLPESPGSLATQVIGSNRLKRIGVDTPTITESIPGVGNEPPMLIMDNAFDKPGAFQITGKGYIQTRETLEGAANGGANVALKPAPPDVLQKTDAAFHELNRAIGEGGFIAPDLNPGNVIYYPKPGGGYVASVVDADMILTKDEFVRELGGRSGQDLYAHANELPRAGGVAFSTLLNGLRLEALDDLTFTPQQMMEHLWSAQRQIIDLARADAR